MAFVGASALFILLEVEFVALIFLIVYVGAIAILFLFVIMMLNLTDLDRGEAVFSYYPVGFLIGVTFLFEMFLLKATLYHVPGIRPYGLDPKMDNIHNLGAVLYTDCFYLLLLASFILLVAMVGAIVLTHDWSISRKRQDLYIQISRLTT